MPFSTLHQPCLAAAGGFFSLFLPRMEDCVLTLFYFQILDICSFLCYSIKRKEPGRLFKQRLLHLLNVYRDKKFYMVI